MAYQINKTDGTILTSVADGQIDELSTDLTLIGKNYSGFGEAINENFVKLLENFSNTARPNNPIRGQLWFDTSEIKLKVYSGLEFVPVSSATISNTQPTTLAIGDLWFNNIDKQLYFYDGSTPLLLGPVYSNSQGISGLKVDSILDTSNQTRVVTYLYNNGILLGIFANDSFTPKAPINGYSGNITPGFNAGDLSGIKFDVTCTNAEQLNGVSATQYLRKDSAAESMIGSLSIVNDSGISIGTAGSGILGISNGNIILTNTAANKDITFSVRRGIIQENAIVIASANRVVSIYSGQLTSQVNIGGSLVVTGDLTVEGTTTTINTATITTEDKNIVLAKQSGTTPTDVNANTGGIVLQGSTSHVLLWSNVGQSATPSSSEALANGYNDGLPALASSAWTSSEHMNLATGKEYKIDGVTVISANALGAGITSIPGVTSFGTQTVLRVGPVLLPGDPPTPYIQLEDNKISTVQPNQDLEIEPNGSGNVVLVGSPKITGLSDPTSSQDAATKEYVDREIESKTIAFSIDLSDSKPNTYIIENILNNLEPPSEHRDLTQARILCNISSLNSVIVDINSQITQSTATFNTPSGTAPAVTNVAISPTTVAAQTITVTRIIKTFQIVGGVWTWVSDNLLPA